MADDRFTAVLNAIDKANSADPEIVAGDDAGSGHHPAALLYGRRMSAELVAFSPDASETLRIAVRGQHIERWKLPRKDYPEGRDGYLAWRRDQAAYHAERVSALMGGCGYGSGDCDRVAKIIRKEGIKRDPEVQALEDIACLVFMRWYFTGFADGRDQEQVFRIVARTARKMSAAGRAAAAGLNIPAEFVAALES